MTPSEIRRRREAVPYSQGELGKIVGVSVVTVRSWEAGRRAPRAKQLRALEAALSSRDECECRCHVLGLRRAAIPRWTRAERDDLRRLVASGATPEEAADALEEAHGWRRSRAAVVDKAGQIGSSFYREQYRSEASVSRAMGVGHWSTRRWINDGLLPAVRHVSIRAGTPSKWWRITSADLETFVSRHAGIAFDPSTIREPALRARAELAAAQNRRQAP